MRAFIVLGFLFPYQALTLVLLEQFF